MKKINKLSVHKIAISLMMMMFFSTLFLAGCGSSNENADDAKKSDYVTEGKITIATGLPTYEPWVADDAPENCEGFEAELACDIAKELGFAPEDIVWIRTGFEEAIAPGDKNFDFNIQQYSPSAEREQSVSFSTPYLLGEQAIVVNGDSQFANAQSLDELKDAKIAVASGTISYEIAAKYFDESQISVYNDVDAAKQAVMVGQADALVNDLVSCIFTAGVEFDDGVIIGKLPSDEEDLTNDSLSILFPKDSPLVSPVNDALDKLKSAGTLDELESKYLSGSGSVATLK
ncbi:MAG: ABC transporter substrate-binding protein [Bifidobacteriaceae bacterium]|jgi:polar amino acid transport system substrate-binding protein|nr:ABC transporter substrate-binding protein [Bifidobacteriaceae bacterium]